MAERYTAPLQDSYRPWQEDVSIEDRAPIYGRSQMNKRLGLYDSSISVFRLVLDWAWWLGR